MTADELDKEIIAIKKQGLTPYVEKYKIAQTRQKYYLAKIEDDKQNLIALFKKNLNFLSQLYNIRYNKHQIDEFLAIKTEDYFQLFLDGKVQLFNLEYVLIASVFFGIPAELLLFTDLEANEQTIRKQYPLIFKQSRN